MIMNKRIEFIKSRYIIDDLPNIKLFMSELNDTVLENLQTYTNLVGDVKLYHYEVKGKVKIVFSQSLFDEMLDSDPTKNKINVQWMLQLVSRKIKNGDFYEAKSFVLEDLPLAKKYLELFESNKRKKLFKDLCKSNFLFKNISDPSNINQYESLSLLYDAIDPFMERNVTYIDKMITKMVDSNKAKIAYRDRRYTIYIPKTVDACIIFTNYVSWCTSSIGNGMFNSYTSKLTPFKERSKLFIVINHDLFQEGEDLEDKFLYQIHFESNQFHNRKQKNSDFFNDVLSKSKGVDGFFKDYLMKCLSTSNFNKISVKNVYLKALVSFGHSEMLFNLLDEFSPIIDVRGTDMNYLPDLSRFENLEFLLIDNCKLKEIKDSLDNLSTLKVLLLTNNNISDFDVSCDYLKELNFINLKGNENIKFNENIKKLDPKNGGSLTRIILDSKLKNKCDYLYEYLPNVKIEYYG